MRCGRLVANVAMKETKLTLTKNLIISGWMMKQGGHWKNWKKRWACISSDGCYLRYFSAKADLDSMKGELIIDSTCSADILDEKENHFRLTTPEREMEIKTFTNFEMLLWVDSINEIVKVLQNSSSSSKYELFRIEMEELKEMFNRQCSSIPDAELAVLESSLANLNLQLEKITQQEEIIKEDIWLAEDLLEQKYLIVSDPCAWWRKFHKKPE